MEQEFGVIKIPLPDGADPISPGKNKPRSSRTALFVPAERLESCQFQPATVLPDILVAKDVTPVLTAIADYGEVGQRSFLEEDPTKKQVIFYAAILANDRLLWYQRAGSQTTATIPPELLGDERLLGKYSIGFGGHKTEEDIHLTPPEQLMLSPLVPGLQRFLERALGPSRGLFAEVEEELGIKPHDIKGVRLSGAFLDNRVTNPADKVQVGWVHLGLPVMIELDPSSITELRFALREVRTVWWIPFKDTLATLEKYMADPMISVESWTEVFIKEFLNG
ncbi:hypothetical protein HY387_00335 [Candidatus Daviesbacteria bacterium]|nr:hypothetical protein [Candidatus Daviesbacteria bacterium]